MMNNKGFVLIIALVAIIVLLILSFYPVSINDEQDKVVSVYPCKTLTTGCKAKLENSQVEIRFPDNVVFLEKFPIEVHVQTLQQKPVDSVNIDFRMVGMDMGLNYYQLKQDKQDMSLWGGEGVLPICTTGRTDWQAIVSLQSGEVTIDKVAFQFEVSPSVQ